MSVGIKRIYENASEGGGARFLVDRLWPRGVSKARAQLDGWLKDAAPSPALCAWFAHKPENFEAFSGQYRRELETDAAKQAAVRRILDAAAAGRVTLVYAARDERINHAAVLLTYLLEKAG